MKNQLQFLIIQKFGQTFGFSPWDNIHSISSNGEINKSSSEFLSCTNYSEIYILMLWQMPSLGLAYTAYSENYKKNNTL
jgi:hypothetical protein